MARIGIPGHTPGKTTFLRTGEQTDACRLNNSGHIISNIPEKTGPIHRAQTPTRKQPPASPHTVALKMRSITFNLIRSNCDSLMPFKGQFPVKPNLSLPLRLQRSSNTATIPNSIPSVKIFSTGCRKDFGPAKDHPWTSSRAHGPGGPPPFSGRCSHRPWTAVSSLSFRVRLAFAT
jgi:hypothetical protein